VVNLKVEELNGCNMTPLKKLVTAIYDSHTEPGFHELLVNYLLIYHAYYLVFKRILKLWIKKLSSIVFYFYIFYILIENKIFSTHYKIDNEIYII